MPDKLVVDTSVFISALIGKTAGASRTLLRLCLTGELQPLMGNALFSEYSEVSSRDRIRERCPLSEKEIEELLNSFLAVCEWVPIYYLWRPNLSDEADNHLVELAVAGNATTIVANNVRDLKNAELSFPELRILTPKQVLKEH